jgi:hypothetical protein
MADKGFKRKLSAILSADAVGYSRLMCDDEGETILSLTTYRSVIPALAPKFRSQMVYTQLPSDRLTAEELKVILPPTPGIGRKLHMRTMPGKNESTHHGIVKSYSANLI